MEEDLDSLLSEFAKRDVETAAQCLMTDPSKPKLTAKQQKEKDAREKAARGVLNARHVELRRMLAEGCRMRRPAPTKAAYKKQKAEAEEDRQRVVAKAKKRQETMTKDEAMKGDVVANHRIHREDKAVRIDFVRKLTRYAWQSMRPTLVKNDGKEWPPNIAYRMRFVMMDDRILEETFVDTLIIGFGGHVHGFSTDDFGGLKEFVEKKGGEINCVPQSLLEDLPGCTKKKADEHVVTFEKLDTEKIPTISPSWWDIPQIPDTFVLREVLTKKEYNDEWPKLDDKLKFQREVRARWAYVNENLGAWRKKFEEKLAQQEEQKKFQRTQAERAPRNVVRQNRKKKRQQNTDVIV